MCGIVGLIARQQSGFFGNDMDIFQNMLIMDMMRGEDSTGVFAVDRTGHVGIMKVGSHPLHLFACEDWKKFKTSVFNRGRILIGHNRKATMGQVNSKNAHPFHENNIVLVHNGTLRQDHRKLADVEVDSHAVCHAFNEKGAEEVIPTINGAFAFVWYDLAKNRLFAIRNEERPLSMIVTERTIALASEAWMAQAMYGREKVKVEKVIDLEPGVLYEFDTTGEYTTKKLALFQPPVSRTTSTTGHSAGACGTGCANEGDWDSENFRAAWLRQREQKTPPTTDLVVVNNGSKSDAAISKIATAYNHDDPNFPKEAEILIKLYEAKLEKGEKDRFVYRMTGKVIHPNKPATDIVGFLPTSDGDNTWQDFLAAPAVTASVLSVSKSTCGDSVWVHSFKLAPLTTVWNGETPFWDHVVKHQNCKDCGAAIFDEEASITVVNIKADNRLHVKCCDCMEDALKGERKDEFIEHRSRTVQNPERVGPKADGPDVRIAAVDGSPTIH